MDNKYCEYYIAGKCLDGDCYVAQRVETNSEETILDYIEKCPKRKTMPNYLAAIRRLETKTQ